MGWLGSAVSVQQKEQVTFALPSGRIGRPDPSLWRLGLVAFISETRILAASTLNLQRSQPSIDREFPGCLER